MSCSPCGKAARDRLEASVNAQWYAHIEHCVFCAPDVRTEEGRCSIGEALFQQIVDLQKQQVQ